MRFLPIILLCLAACTGPAIGWSGVEASEDPHPPADRQLRSYKEAHYRALGRDFVETLSPEELVAELRGVRVLFVGDHHRDVALHDSHLDLLEQIRAAGIAVALALEAIGTQDQERVAGYLDGRTDLDDLRARIRARWPDSWLDSPDVDAFHYRALLEFARRTATPVVALEPTPRPPLRHRDAGMAERVAAALDGVARDRLLVVVVGHTHLRGDGGIEARIDAPSVVLGARLSNTLRARHAARAWPRGSYLRTDAGVVFPPEAH